MCSRCGRHRRVLVGLGGGRWPGCGVIVVVAVAVGVSSWARSKYSMVSGTYRSANSSSSKFSGSVMAAMLSTQMQLNETRLGCASAWGVTGRDRGEEDREKEQNAESLLCGRQTMMEKDERMPGFPDAGVLGWGMANGARCWLMVCGPSLLVAVGIWREEECSAKRQRLVAGCTHHARVGPFCTARPLTALRVPEGWRQFGWLPELAPSCRRPDKPAAPWSAQTHQEQAPEAHPSSRPQHTTLPRSTRLQDGKIQPCHCPSARHGTHNVFVFGRRQEGAAPGESRHWAVSGLPALWEHRCPPLSTDLT